jgi:phenylacetate-CoA ligase
MIHWPIEIYKMQRNLRVHRKELERLRFTLLKDQLLRAYEDVSFYRNTFKQRALDPQALKNIEELRNYPIIGRKELQQDNAGFLSRKFSKQKLQKSHSSGSTGRPLWTYFDQNAWKRKKYISKLRSRLECGLRLGQKIAAFDTAPPQVLAARNQKIIFSNPALKVKYFSIFNGLESNLDELIRWGPQFIDSPPSHLFQLAQLMEQKKRKAASVKKLFTSSEFLEPNMKQFIEKTFGAEIFDIYGCTEIKEIAWECEAHEGYHINEDEVIVEVLNGSQPAKPREIGDIVLTDLRNTAMPLIRYRIGDRGALLPNPCRCGRVFSLMVPAAGRSSEHIITPGGVKISPYRFTTAIEKTKGLLQYQFVQGAEDSITIKVIMDKHGREKEIQEVHDTIQSILGVGMTIQVVRCDKIDIEENGKYKVVKCKIG